MAYQIKDFAKLTGVSERTLRYYNEIGLLTPQRAENGYREYTSQDADLLQLILMYRQLKFDLNTIHSLLELPLAQRIEQLKSQQKLLIQQHTELTQTLQQMANTLDNYQKEHYMNDPEKFSAFKQAEIDKNQKLYGTEIVDQYGVAQQREANQHFSQLSHTQYQQMQNAEEQLSRGIQQYLISPALPSDLAQQIFQAHQTWLKLASPQYSLAMHRGLAEIYVSDERFKHYYTKLVGNIQAAETLKVIIDYYAQ